MVTFKGAAAAALLASRAGAFVAPLAPAGAVARRASAIAAAGKGFGAEKEPKIRDGGVKAISTAALADGGIFVMMARRFIQLKNLADLDEIFRLCTPDVEVYGTKGFDAAKAALADFYRSHPLLTHEVRESDMTVLGLGKVGYRFTKSWLDPDDGSRKTWVSYDGGRSKMETVEFAPDGRIRRVAVEEYDPANSPFDADTAAAVAAGEGQG